MCKRPYYVVYGCFFLRFYSKVYFPLPFFTIESDPVKIADTVNEVNSNKTAEM